MRMRERSARDTGAGLEKMRCRKSQRYGVGMAQLVRVSSVKQSFVSASHVFYNIYHSNAYMIMEEEWWRGSGKES